MEKHELKAKIEKELKDLPENFAVNLIIDQHIYSQANLALLRHLIEELHQGLYVSLNKPYETLHEELKQSNLDPSAIYCIDCVSKETGKFSNSEKCLCLEDPSSLTELSVLTANLLDDRKIRFIILDSLSTLLLYNDAKEVEKFLHGLFNKTRKSNASIIITSPKEKSKEDLFAEITQFCDKEIEL